MSDIPFQGRHDGALGDSDAVGPFAMHVVVGIDAPESAERWERRGEALANWLLEEWNRERREAAA